MRVPKVGLWATSKIDELVVPPLRSFRSSPDIELPDGTFAQLFEGHQGRNLTKWAHYFGIYDRLLAPFRQGFPMSDGSTRPLHLLEIGVRHGGSLELWREFFGPSATIFGIDLDPRCTGAGRDDLPIRIGSQDDPEFLRAVVSEMGGLDIVIDDGSHVARHQRRSFDTLFPLLEDGGLYVVEDTHTAYWLRYGGGYRRPGSFISLAKGMVDGMHGWYFKSPRGDRFTLAQHQIGSIEFFDSIVAIRKQLHGRPSTVARGTRSF